MTQMRSIEVTSRMAVTLSVKLCDPAGAHKQIIATAFPTYSTPKTYSGPIRFTVGGPSQSYAEFNVGDQMHCATEMGSGTNAYTLLTPVPYSQLSVSNTRMPGQAVYDVTIPFGASYNPNVDTEDCTNPKRYTYSVTNGSLFDEDFTLADMLVSGTIRLNIKSTVQPTGTTSVVSVCGITVT